MVRAWPGATTWGCRGRCPEKRGWLRVQPPLSTPTSSCSSARWWRTRRGPQVVGDGGAADPQWRALAFSRPACHLRAVVGTPAPALPTATSATCLCPPNACTNFDTPVGVFSVVVEHKRDVTGSETIAGREVRENHDDSVRWFFRKDAEICCHGGAGRMPAVHGLRSVTHSRLYLFTPSV